MTVKRGRGSKKCAAIEIGGWLANLFDIVPIEDDVFTQCHSWKAESEIKAN